MPAPPGYESRAHLGRRIARRAAEHREIGELPVCNASQAALEPRCCSASPGVSGQRLRGRERLGGRPRSVPTARRSTVHRSMQGTWRMRHRGRDVVWASLESAARLMAESGYHAPAGTHCDQPPTLHSALQRLGPTAPCGRAAPAHLPEGQEARPASRCQTQKRPPPAAEFGRRMYAPPPHALRPAGAPAAACLPAGAEGWA